MPQTAWSNKRERQYEHIKEGYEKRGKSEDTAEEIAARTVNKERSQAGETKRQKNKKGKSGPERPTAGKSEGRTREQLYEAARKKGVEGRSKMSKDELKKAVGR
jgi:plasmid stabilization system protein ParE